MAKYLIKYKGKDYQKTFGYSDVTDKLDSLCSRNFTKEDLYMITLWKVNRFPIINDDIIDKLNTLRSLDTINEEKTRDALNLLLDIKGVRLPMASTYLRFLNPNIYQIIDVRAYRAAFCYDEKRPDYTKASNDECIDIYLNYLNRLREIAQIGYYGVVVEFKDLDRFLYEIDKEAKFKINDKVQHSKEDCEATMMQIIEKFIKKAQQGLKK